MRGYYPSQVDMSVQGRLDHGVNHSVQIGIIQNDMSIQKYEDGMAVDCSIQKYDDAGQDVSIQKSSIRHNDISIQKTSINHHDASIQKSTLSRNDRSIQPSAKGQDRSVSMSFGERSIGVQEVASVREQANQLTIADKED